MEQGYFHRVMKETPTRFWINNPTLKEAGLALKAGAEYCTTNPTYADKMLRHPHMSAMCGTLLREAVEEESDDSLAASLVQRKIVSLIMPAFLDIYHRYDGKRGWVSIQGDPEKEEDPAAILGDAEEGLKLERNYIAKIPVTESGLAAMAILARERVPLIATEVMSLSQTIAACETYGKAVGGMKHPAPIYVTNIAGIFDQKLAEWKRDGGNPVDDGTLGNAGFLLCRKALGIIEERRYPVTLLGGGARQHHHFTDFVGADMHVTINWKGTAENLINENKAVENHYGRTIPESVTHELLDRVPIFKMAWDEEGMTPAEFGDFPPVVLFRSMFLKGWAQLLNRVRDVRNGK